jgi:hypothetical protein
MTAFWFTKFGSSAGPKTNESEEALELLTNFISQLEKLLSLLP